MARRYRIAPILSSLIMLLLAGCDWVKNDLEDCPTGYWLSLDYSYNLQDINAASNLEDVTVLAYDSLGQYVTTINSTKAERLQNDGRIELKDFKPGTYSFIVWAGLSDKEHFAMNHSFGQLLRDSLRVGLKYPTHVQKDDFDDLYYGSISGVKLNGGPKNNLVKMMKDTNKLVCLVRYVGGELASTDQFTMDVLAPNGTMNSKNQPIGDIVTYLPYSEKDVTIIDEEQSDTVSAVRYGFQLMRLMTKDNSRLRLKERLTGDVVVDLPLTQYIGQISVLYDLYGQPLSEQEYLDRQDFHTFVFYISKEKDNVLSKLRINNWIVRLYDDIHLNEEK